MIGITTPPKMVYDEMGQLVEVILNAKDFKAYLRSISSEADWETLPSYLQDVIDQLLIDEVRSEKDGAFDLDAVLSNDVS